jgi:Zn-dependent protease
MSSVIEKEDQRVYAPPPSFRTSRTELLHLAVGMGVFFIIEASSLLRFGVTILTLVAGLTGLAFIHHELAHKLTAQQYGLWSEFRIDPFGALVSLLTAISPFKIIAPGAVRVFGSRITLEGMGKIALAGPLTNIIQVPVFVFLSMFYPLFWVAAIMNADLALFNLIPLSILDGRKVFRWNKTIWTTAFVAAFIVWIVLRILL